MCGLPDRTAELMEARLIGWRRVIEEALNLGPLMPMQAVRQHEALIARTQGSGQAAPDKDLEVFENAEAQ